MSGEPGTVEAEGKTMEVVAKAAGLGGIAVAGVLFLYGKIVDPAVLPWLSGGDRFTLLQMLLVLSFLLGVAGIIAWALIEKGKGKEAPAPAPQGQPNVQAHGGVASGGGIENTTVNISGQPPAPAPAQGGITAVGGVATGGDITGSKITLGGGHTDDENKREG